MSKVIVRVKGGLGNQLFCYAAAKRLASVNNSELVIDDVTGFLRDHEYRRRYALDRFNISARKATPKERLEPLERYRRGLAKLVARHRPFHRRKYIQHDGIDFEPHLLDYIVDGSVYLDGYWQNETYFQDVEQLIRQELQIIPPKDSINKEMARRIRDCEAVCIHVRWFQNFANEANSDLNLVKSYYTLAMKIILDKVKSPHFFLFSDDLRRALSTLNLHENEITCVAHNHRNENSYADLWLMTQCKNFIIANSTFSWWGAWLAEAKARLVIAPSIKLAGGGDWGFQGLIPQNWHQL